MSESIVDRYLGSQPGKFREKNVLYTVDLTKVCLRQAYFDIVSPKPFDVSTLRMFEAGRLVEDLVVRVLSQSEEYVVLGTQVAARWFTDWGSVHGRVDVLAQRRGGSLVCFEVKSIKNFFYLDGPKPEHRQQLNFYLSVLNMDFGELFYVSKDALLNGGEGGPVERRFVVQRDAGAFAAMVGRADELHAAVSGGVVPVGTPHWVCSFCGHKGVECVG